MSQDVDAQALLELIDRYCAVWNESRPERRAALLEQVWAPGASYTDPTVHAANAGELLAHIEKVRARRPGCRVLRTSALDCHHGMLRFSWHVVQADGTALPDGLDVVELSSDGQQIKRIVGFFGALQPMNT